MGKEKPLGILPFKTGVQTAFKPNGLLVSAPLEYFNGEYSHELILSIKIFVYQEKSK